MGKLDELTRAGGANVAESAGLAGPRPPRPQLNPAQAVGQPARLAGLKTDRGAYRIPLERIVPDPNQPRREFDPEALERLAESLRSRGQLQPIRVRWDEGQGAYVIVVGERRWRAARQAGLPDLSCILVEGELSPEERLSIQLVENALRDDLRPVEQARAYKVLMASLGWSASQLARELHLAQPTVAKALALLELPAAVQDQVDSGALAATAAYEVARLPESEQQIAVAQVAVEQRLTRDEVAEMARTLKARRPAPAPRPDPVTLDVAPRVQVVVRYRGDSQVSAEEALELGLALLRRARGDEAA
jgi:ParB family chromosome partitioning protein